MNKPTQSFVRFSPSPTGHLHVGNARTAIVNYLYAKQNNLGFILRIDDTDVERSQTIYTDDIKTNLEWLGIVWDKIITQSERLEIYNEYKTKLIGSGHLYACYETPEELNIQKNIQKKSSLPPIYNRHSLHLSQQQKFDYEQEGRKPYYRFKLDDALVSWADRVYGRLSFKKMSFSDPIVFKVDGLPTYTFASVIDDHDLDIAMIIRGEDHISNTAVQIQIFNAITNQLPEFAHLSLLKTETKISKRVGGFELSKLREKHIDPITIINYLAFIGTSKNIPTSLQIEGILQDYSINNFSKSQILYDEEHLIHLNKKIICQYSLEQINAQLKHYNISLPLMNEEFWTLVKHNVHTIEEIIKWYDICYNDFIPDDLIESNSFITNIASSLLPDSLAEFNWQLWIEDITKHTDAKGKKLFTALRLAITNQTQGPELKLMIPLIGLETIKKRLSYKK